MPYISVECCQISKNVKKELIKTITKESSKIMNIPEEFFTVTIKELPDDSFGIGGTSIDEVKAKYQKEK